MGNQGIGDQREQLVENKQGERVRRERDPDGCGDRQREADVKTRLMGFVVAAHVADRIDRAHQP
jgi:hypothetical protein